MITISTKTRNILWAEGAVASILFSLGTGNFITGYLNLLGASPAFCALLIALPQMGCILQLVSPFLFERMRCRKALIISCCFLFRFSLGLAAFIPCLFTNKAMGLTGIFILYTLAFLAAGFVTPGLNNWVLGLAPVEKRGAFFAWKDIIASISNALVLLLMAGLVDWFRKSGQIMVGYFVIFFTAIFLSLLDFFLLFQLKEKASTHIFRPSLRQMLLPLKNKEFRPYILFLVLWFFSLNLSASFLPIYQISYLGLSHTYITALGVIASVFGILGSFLWGRTADRFHWLAVLRLSGMGMAVGYLVWSFLTKDTAAHFTPIAHCLVTGCQGGFNMASLNLQYLKSPESGKTIYLGLTAALANLCGYFSTILGSVLQNTLSRILGLRSISFLFLLSAVLLIPTVIIFLRKAKA